MIKRIILVFLLMSSGSVFADSYPYVAYYTSSLSAIHKPTPGDSCADTATHALYPYNKVLSPTSCGIYTDSFLTHLYTTYGITLGYSCPGGGNIDNNYINCINAPACPTGQYRPVATGICQAPVFCLYPEDDDGTGHCAVPPECPSPNKYNYIIHSCALPPVCGATERFNPATFVCNPNPLQCPGHSHASTQNDRCLPDPALTCAIGQHDDGAYNCVANNAPAPCNANQQKGYINGIPQCVPKPNLDTRQQEAAAAAGASSAAASVSSAAFGAAKTAADASVASAAASAADPTNTTKSNQAAADVAAKTTADAAAKTAADAAAAAKAASDKADNDAKNVYLKTIADEAKAASDRANARKGGSSSTCTAPPTCEGDAVNCAILQQSWANSCRPLDDSIAGDIPVKDALTPVQKTVTTLNTATVSGSCPAAQSFMIQGTQMTVSYQFICDYASAIKFLVIALAWIGAGFIVFGSIRS